MKYRKKLGKRKSRRLFTRTASRTRRKNVQMNATPMRGGFRL